MTTLAIGKTFTFSAAHALPNHNGRCRRLHGHNYKVELRLTGEIVRLPALPLPRPATPSDLGMVMDFAELSPVIERIKDALDHQYLNDVLPSQFFPPTAENLATYIWDQVYTATMYTNAELEYVRVWETDTCYAEIRKS